MVEERVDSFIDMLNSLKDISNVKWTEIEENIWSRKKDNKEIYDFLSNFEICWKRCYRC